MTSTAEDTLIYDIETALDSGEEIADASDLTRHRCSDALSDCLVGGAQGVGRQMRVSLCRRRLGMAQELADYRQ